MRISIFDVIEPINPSLHRYVRELAAAFPADAQAEVVSMPKSPGLKGRFYDVFLKYPQFARDRQGDFNIIASEGYSHLLLALDPHRTGVVCHDVHPLLGGPGGLYRLRFKGNLRLLRHARAVVTVSETTRSELLQFCPFLSAQKVRAVHSGLSQHWRPVPEELSRSEVRRKLGLADSDLILHVGNSNWYKNFGSVARAFALLQRPNAMLLKVGILSSADKQLLRELRLEDRLIHIPQANDDALLSYYQAAALLLFPSLHEGFGWPPLEAMACGCPVITSRRGAIPEICGEACLYADPQKPADLASAVEKLLADSPSRAELIAKGRERARQYDWKKTASQIVQILQAG